MSKSWLKTDLIENAGDYIKYTLVFILMIIFIVCLLHIGHKVANKVMDIVFDSDTPSSNLPTCPDSEKIVIGYRNGKPMKLCDQTYTFIFQDWNYSCMLTNNKDSGILGFARGLGLNEKDSIVAAIATANQIDAAKATSCDLGRLSPEFIQKWYSGKGDGSVLTHTETLGF